MTNPRIEAIEEEIAAIQRFVDWRQEVALERGFMPTLENYHAQLVADVILSEAAEVLRRAELEPTDD